MKIFQHRCISMTMNELEYQNSMKKKRYWWGLVFLKNLNIFIHIFLLGGVEMGEIFILKLIIQGLLHLYNKYVMKLSKNETFTYGIYL
jgi:hypothetical protein